MPTLPSRAPSPTTLLRLRDVAESFGGDAERYDRTRPRYPDVLVHALAAEHPRILEVGGRFVMTDPTVVTIARRARAGEEH